MARPPQARRCGHAQREFRGVHLLGGCERGAMADPRGAWRREWGLTCQAVVSAAPWQTLEALGRREWVGV